MGQVHAVGLNYESPVKPKTNQDPTFPANYGFEERGETRRERVMIATKDEMIAAKVPYKYRDFCAHKYIQFKACARSVYPIVIKCEHERHEWEECMFEDQTISRKEFEREQRLLLRKQRKERIAALKEERQKAFEDTAEAEH
ncbi:unnamed protein product [Allacma fusca]|uniref:NADH dehydrogenase [ubiquinone] 1 beta subcomplex subunit 7 n=1 Tax=Allacma fusca TaxID=39272 RepID=A0A8J2NU61_9HEXA|nr:unnamed protein product [Allacma fusca]